MDESGTGSASLTLQRKAAIGGLLTLGGTVNARVQLRDVTAGTITTLASEAISAADTSFGKHSLAIEPSLLEQGHSYRVVLTTNLAVAALLSGVRVSYDDVAITGSSPTPEAAARAYRHEWRQRRGERLRLRPRHARGPGCRTADAARRTARRALHAGPAGDDPDPRDARGKARQARRRDPAHGRRDAARLDGP